MQISAALAIGLATLTDALDEPGADLAETLRGLAADVTTAVHSYLGLSIELTAGGNHVTGTALEDRAEPGNIRTSLRLSLPVEPPAGGHSTVAARLILYAGTPGAFVDIAADLARVTRAGVLVFALDEDLTGPDDPGPPDGFTTLSAMNQAVGVLIGRGDTPEQAERHLHRLATDAGVDRAAAATTILADIDVGPAAGQP